MQLDRKQIYVQGAFFRLFQHQPIASERILWLTNNSEIFLKNIQQCKDLSTKQRIPKSNQFDNISTHHVHTTENFS